MIINIEQICSINIRKKDINNWYVYKKKKTFLGIIIRKEGFYYEYTISPYLVLQEDISEECYIENNTVYYKPYVEIRMSNNKMYKLYFENEEELNNWINNPQLNKIKKLEIQ